MARQIFEFFKTCKGCNVTIPCGLIRGDKVVCPKCGTEVTKEQTLFNFNLSSIRYKLQAMTPRYWLANEPVNSIWDKKLNEWLDDPNATIERYDKYCAIVNKKVLVWIENYPYAYGNFYGYRGPLQGFDNKELPARSTRIRLYERMKTAPQFVETK
jgi:hypothetical protein